MFINEKTITIGRMVPYFVLSFFSGAFENQATQLSLPMIQNELRISVALSQWFSSISIITKAAFSIPLSCYGIMLGAKLSVCLSMLVSAAACVLVMFATQFWQLLALKLVIGACQTCAMQCNQYLIYQLLSDDKSKRVTFMRQQRIITSVISVLSPLIASYIIENLNWRYNYAVVATGSLLRALFVSFCIQGVSRQKSTCSFWNQFSLTLALLSVSVGFTLLSFEKFLWAFFLVVLAIPLTAIFMSVEQLSQKKIFDRDHASRISLSLAVVLTIMGTIQSCESLVAPQYFSSTLGGVDILGYINTAKSFAAFVIIVTIQALLQKHKVQPSKLARWSSYGIVCSIGLILASSYNIWAYTAFYLLRAIAATPLQITLRPIMIVLVPKQNMHKITSLSSTMQTLANCLARALISMILQLTSARYSGEQYWVGVEICYAMMFCIAIAACALIIRLLANNKAVIDKEEVGSDSETQSLDAPI